MPPMQGSFDATQVEPKFGGMDNHPVGRFPFTIVMTAIVENKEKTGGFLQIDLQSPVGTIPIRLNLWNPSEKAKEIARNQLAMVCHVTGIMRLQYENEGAALRGGVGMMEVGYQKGEEPTPEKPHGGYTEVKKLFDRNGNEPGKGPGPAAQPTQAVQQPQGQPMTVNPGGTWSQQGTQQPANQQPPQGWHQQPNQQPPNQQQPSPGWNQQQPNPGQTAPNPPWRT